MLKSIRLALRPLAIVLGTMFLGACTTAQQGLLQKGVEDIKKAKDSEARLLKQAVCATSIGANNRVNTLEERAALDVLCGGSKRETVTTEDVLLLSRLMGLIKAAGLQPLAVIAPPVPVFEPPMPAPIELEPPEPQPPDS